MKKKNIDNINELKKLIEQSQCYQVNSKWKARQVVKDIKSGEYGDRRIIIWTMFIETQEQLKQDLSSVGIGWKTFDELNEWKEGTEQVLIGRIKAHGKGGNVPQASVSLFIDMDFVPANNIQAENRTDRPEQQNEMLNVYYMAEGDDVIDNHIRKINQEKAQKIAMFMKPLTEQEIAEMPIRLANLRLKFREQCQILGI